MQILDDLKAQTKATGDARQAEEIHMNQLKKLVESLQMDIGKLRADRESAIETQRLAISVSLSFNTNFDLYSAQNYLKDWWYIIT